jgi:hypothetical protein
MMGLGLGFRGAAGPSAEKVFICYRREETAAHAGRLYDAMVARFGEGNVFIDVDDLGPGVDFVERIDHVLSECRALVVVMGPSWAAIEDGQGGRRIDDPDDFVRREVKSGLGSKATVIPVLVSGAGMPRRESLPEELRPIARRNALELSETRWAHDVGRLFGVLEELLPAGVGGKAVAPTSVRPGWRLTLEGMLVAGVTAAVAYPPASLLPVPKEAEASTGVESTQGTVEHIVGTILTRAAILAAVGAALAFWLASWVRRIDSPRPVLRGLLIGAGAGAIAGAVWGLLVFLPDEKVVFETRAKITLGAIAVGGAGLGALIGWLWIPRRAAVALAFGAAGGVLFQYLGVIATDWKNNGGTAEIALSYGLGAAAIAGLALAAMVVLDYRRLRSARSTRG